jgi:hypothetical protein
MFTTSTPLLPRFIEAQRFTNTGRHHPASNLQFSIFNFQSLSMHPSTLILFEL